MQKLSRLSVFIFMLLVLSVFIQLTFAQSNSSDLEKFKQSWIAKALALQREMDLKTPLNEATFLGTHNSENSKSYAIPYIRYVDPNQLLSIYDQLELGVRSLEFDVQWTRGKQLKNEILLSHCDSKHIGCSPFDKPFSEGLSELRDWLKANPKEVVLLFLDRTLDGHEPRAAWELNRVLGDFIYKPTFIQATQYPHPQPGCESLPGSLTKEDVLKAGKQLLVVAKNCDGLYPNYQETDQFPLPWNEVVFAGIGKTTRNPFTFIDSTMNDFTPFPDCDYSTNFYDDPKHTSMWRIFEDRTFLSGLVRPQRKLLPDDMTELLRCGINWPTLDMLEVNDARLARAVWSWAPSFPIDNLGQCAIYKKELGIMNVACNKPYSAYACHKNKPSDWVILEISGLWSEGEKNCRTLGKGWHFGVPINGQQMYFLKEALEKKSISDVLINYHANGQDHWEANVLKG